MPPPSSARPIYAGPRPIWQDRLNFILSLLIAITALIASVGNFALHRPIIASIYLATALLAAYQARRTYRRRP